MADWDTNSPADSDIVSQYPANERAARSAVRSNFGIDHHEANDADVGKHEVVQIIDNAGDPTVASGQIGVWNNGGKLNTRVASGTVQRIMKGESGTKMVFYQASPPTGWTQDTAVNDRVLRVVSGSGGTTGGSWTISGVTVDGHALSVSEMPAHDHGGASGSTSPGTNSAGSHTHEASAGSSGTEVAVDTSRFYWAGETWTGSGEARSPNNAIKSAGAHSHTVNAHTHSIASQGSGAAHNHGVTADGNWRPSHIDVIVASLD